MRTRYQRIAIISSELSGLRPDLNALFTESLEKSLKRHQFEYTRCLGHYDGHTESSFLVVLPDDSAEDYLKHLGRLYEQESILIQDEEGKARLEYLDARGGSESIGQLKPVTKEQAESSVGYTYVPSTDSYWVAS